MMESRQLAIPARFVDVLLQSCLHLVICQEGHVAWMSHCQEVPVPQNRSPGLDERGRENISRPRWLPLAWQSLQFYMVLESDEKVAQGHTSRTNLEPYLFRISEPFISEGKKRPAVMIGQHHRLHKQNSHNDYCSRPQTSDSADSSYSCYSVS